MAALFVLALLTLMALVGGCVTKSEEKAAATPPSPPPADGIPADHPDLDEQEMYTACSDCHRDETPDVYEQWWNSAHGIATVKCYQCHGTYEDMMRVPATSNCMFCHEEQTSQMDGTLTCWQCHSAHHFTGHHSERGEG